MKSKRIVSSVLSLSLAFSMFTTSAFAASVSYKDTESHWAKAAIQQWSDYGVLKGNGNQFKPNDSITRGELAVILDRVMAYQASSDNTFSDLGKAHYTDALLRANKAGLIRGSGSMIRPNDNVTREETAVIIGRAFGVTESVYKDTQFKDAAVIAPWASGYVNALEEKKYITGKGQGNFDPKGNITRAEMVKILDNIVKAFYNKPGTYSSAQTVEGSVVINKAGVVLENTTIKGDLIIAEGVGEGEVTLNNVKIEGNTIIKGGGENSIIFNNVTVGGALVVNKVDGKLRIVAAGSTSVNVTVLNSGAILVERELVGGGFEKVEISAEVAAGQQVVLKGNFTTVTNNAAKVAIDATGSIEKLELKQSATVTGDSKIKEVAASEGTESTLNGKKVEAGTAAPGGTTPPGGGGGFIPPNTGNGDGNGTVTGTTYSVKFNSNGGSVVDALTVKQGGTVTKPADPTKENFIFGGWYKDETLTTAWDFNVDVVTGDVILYAKWSKESTGWQPPTYVDPLFAPGYPQASVDQATGKLVIKVKLNDSITESNPAKVYSVTGSTHEYDDTNVEAIVHGHLGGSYVRGSDEWFMNTISDGNEYTIQTDTEIGLIKYDYAVFFAIESGAGLSTQATQLTFLSEVITEMDTREPFTAYSFVNKAHNKLTFYYDEPLDTASVPSVNDFKFRGIEGAGISKVSITNAKLNESGGWSYYPGTVSLDVYGIDEGTEITNLWLAYTAPTSGGIQDMSINHNKAQSFIHQVKSAQPVLDQDQIYISDDLQYISFSLKPTIDLRDHTINERDIVTVKYGVDYDSAKTIQYGIRLISSGYDTWGMGLYVEDMNRFNVVEDGKFFIEIKGADVIELKDLAGDQVETFRADNLTANVKKVTVTEAVYENSTIKLRFSNSISNHQALGCEFVLNVNGKDYSLRGTISKDYLDYNNFMRTIVINMNNIPIDIPSDAILNIRYEQGLNHDNSYDILRDNSGRPIESFKDIQVINKNLK